MNSNEGFVPSSSRASRFSDPVESKKAAVGSFYRRGSQRHQLLQAYSLGATWDLQRDVLRAAPGLTDEEAGRLVLKTWGVEILNPHKRC